MDETVAQFTSEALFRERLHNRLNRVLTFSFANVIGKAQQKEKDRQSQPRQENQPGQETEKEYHGRPPTEIFGVLPGTWMEEIRGGQTVNGKRVNVAFAKSDGIIETMEGKRIGVNRLLIAALSGFFRRAFYGYNLEADAAHVTLTRLPYNKLMAFLGVAMRLCDENQQQRPLMDTGNQWRTLQLDVCMETFELAAQLDCPAIMETCAKQMYDNASPLTYILIAHRIDECHPRYYELLWRRIIADCYKLLENKTYQLLRAREFLRLLSENPNISKSMELEMLDGWTKPRVKNGTAPDVVRLLRQASPAHLCCANFPTLSIDKTETEPAVPVQNLQPMEVDPPAPQEQSRRVNPLRRFQQLFQGNNGLNALRGNNNAEPAQDNSTPRLVRNSTVTVNAPGPSQAPAANGFVTPPTIRHRTSQTNGLQAPPANGFVTPPNAGQAPLAVPGAPINPAQAQQTNPGNPVQAQQGTPPAPANPVQNQQGTTTAPNQAQQANPAAPAQAPVQSLQTPPSSTLAPPTNTHGIGCPNFFKSSQRLPYSVITVMGGWATNGPSACAEVFNGYDEKWIEPANHVLELPTPRSYHEVIPMMEKKELIIIGGFDGNNYYEGSTIYDLESMSWVENSHAFMNEKRCYVSSCLLDDTHIMAAGGYNNRVRLSSTEILDTTLNLWQVGPRMNTVRSDCHCTKLNDRLYVVGGFDGHNCHQTVEYFDAPQNRWVTVSEKMKDNRSGVCAIGIYGVVLSVGGFTGRSRLRSGEFYDPREGKWHSVASMNSARSNFGIAELRDDIYVCGGYDGHGTTTRCERFDFRANRWTELDEMKVRRSALAMCRLDGDCVSREFVQKRERR